MCIRDSADTRPLAPRPRVAQSIPQCKATLIPPLYLSTLFDPPIELNFSVFYPIWLFCRTKWSTFSAISVGLRWSFCEILDLVIGSRFMFASEIRASEKRAFWGCNVRKDCDFLFIGLFIGGVWWIWCTDEFYSCYAQDVVGRWLESVVYKYSVMITNYWELECLPVIILSFGIAVHWWLTV